MRKQLLMIACVVLPSVVLIWHLWHILGLGNKQIASEDVTEAKIVPVTGLTDSAKAILQKNGFVVVAEEYRWQNFPAFYGDCKLKGQPILITTDTMLHVSHLVFDWYLRFLEIAHLRSDLLNLTDSGIAMSTAYWEKATNENIK